jgi:mono/diheme cytochrome c family protein
MKRSSMNRFTAILALLAGTLAQAASAAPAPDSDQALVERGRYLARIAGCNDCHTPGYNQAAGKVPESQWLTGDRLGWRGPWGTTYASNLRLYVAGISEKQWLQRVATLQSRPPMPYFSLQAMSERDLRALYRFVRALGPAGEPAPAWLPPDKVPPMPYAQFP